jgi:hypothetical protein
MKTKIFFATCLLLAAIAAPWKMTAQQTKVEVTDTPKMDVEEYSKSIGEITKEISRLSHDMGKLQQELAKKQAAKADDKEIKDLEKQIEAMNMQMEAQSDKLEDIVENMQEQLSESLAGLPYKYEYEYTANDTDGDTTSTKDSSDEIIIRINDQGISWRKDGKEEMMHNKKRKAKKNLPKYKTQMFGLDLGVNAFAQKLNGSTSAERDPMALDVAKSIDVNLHLFRQGISLYKNHLYLTTGIDIDFHNFRLDKDIALTAETDSFKYSVLPEKLKRNKLEVNYITIPVMLHLESNPSRPDRSFKLGFGGFGGLRYTSYTKQVTTDGKKTKEHDDFNLNPITYGVRGQIGYGPLTVYSQYAMSPLFASGHGAPELNPVTFGIVVNGFKWRN